MQGYSCTAVCTSFCLFQQTALVFENYISLYLLQLQVAISYVLKLSVNQNTDANRICVWVFESSLCCRDHVLAACGLVRYECSKMMTKMRIQSEWYLFSPHTLPLLTQKHVLFSFSSPTLQVGRTEETHRRERWVKVQKRK